MVDYFYVKPEEYKPLNFISIICCHKVSYYSQDDKAYGISLVPFMEEFILTDTQPLNKIGTNTIAIIIIVNKSIRHYHCDMTCLYYYFAIRLFVKFFYMPIILLNTMELAILKFSSPTTRL